MNDDSGEQISVKLGDYLAEVQKLIIEMGRLLNELLPAYLG